MLPHASLSDSETADFIAQMSASDNCRGCGRAYSSNDPILAGFSHAGAPLEVGACCVAKLGALVCSGGYFSKENLPAAALAQIPAKGRA